MAHSCHNVYFVRHGESQANVAPMEALVGFHRDAQLTKSGKRQAIRTGEFLAKFEPDFKDCIFVCSLLVRAIETAILLTRAVTSKTFRPTIFIIEQVREYKWTQSSNPRPLDNLKEYLSKHYPDDIDRIDFSGVSQRHIYDVNQTSVLAEVSRFYRTATDLPFVLNSFRVRNGAHKKIVLISHGGYLQRNVSHGAKFHNCDVWYNGIFLHDPENKHARR